MSCDKCAQKARSAVFHVQRFQIAYNVVAVALATGSHDCGCPLCKRMRKVAKDADRKLDLFEQAQTGGE